MRPYFIENDSNLFEDVNKIEVYVSKTLLETIERADIWNRKKLRSYLRDKYGKKYFSCDFILKDKSIQSLKMNLTGVLPRIKKIENEVIEKEKEKIMNDNNNSDNKEILKTLMVVVESLKSSNENLMKELKDSHKANQAMQEKLMQQQIQDLKELVKSKAANDGGGGLDLMQLLETVNQLKNMQGAPANGQS